ncbi:MAG: hypothetical protein IJL09_04345, partial [Lachnospiraceae bacterium]|nr:hypothetical protein [Lachnospiraceae bacterium]
MEEKTKEMNANMPSDNELDANMPSDNELDANMLNETELGDVGGGKTEPRNLLYQGPKYPQTPDITRTCQPKAGNQLYKDEKH